MNNNKEIVLRPYQQEAMRALDHALELGKRRFLIELPTGTGKTIGLGDVAITTDSVSGGYQMVDPSRGGGSTLDSKGASYSSAAGSATLFTDTDNVLGNNTNSDRASATTSTG